MTATMHLTDGTAVTGITTYSTVTPDQLSDTTRAAHAISGPVYTVFAHGTHRYIAIERVRDIVPSEVETGTAWYDLPMAAGMWAADGADMGA